MAENTQDTNAPSEQQNTLWEAAQYVQALAHLERLQEQLDRMRSTIPSLVAPLIQPASSKAQMFANIRKAAIQSTDDIKHFRESWTSDQTQQLFTRSRGSLEKDDDLTKAQDVARWGWSDR